ncbi:hypothetical protein P2B84_13300 [Xanthomonas perforans]
MLWLLDAALLAVGCSPRRERRIADTQAAHQALQHDHLPIVPQGGSSATRIEFVKICYNMSLLTRFH